ncbi:MAG TPA: VWA domain-containing protein [Candidatus Limnocylindrales bacterium]|nr:VWA domain-containing protein [Candidatus Limnocylindrales bacterium]
MDGRFADVPFTGQRVDGARLLAQAVGFGRALRAAGLQADLSAAVDFARALTLLELGDRTEVRAAGAAVFVRRRDERPTYDRVFDRWWRRRGRALASPPAAREPEPGETPEEPAGGEPAPLPGDERTSTEMGPTGLPVPGEDEDADEAPLDRVIVAPDAYSRGEVLRHREFDRMTPAELRDAERLVDLLTPRLERRPTRRYRLDRHGVRLAPRAMFRRNLATGGELYDWEWQRRLTRPRPLVVLCDISGSMERHSRLLLRFVQALSQASAVRTESFVFGTRLTRVTRLLRDRDRDRALARVADSVVDWAGGTRIGESFRDFNLRWARRTLRSSGVVIVVSDGWDRGDPRLVAEETARLRRSCHRLIWLNPLAGTPGYRPLAAGMAAAYPFVDDFLAAGTVASLERLGEILAGGPQARGRESRPAPVTERERAESVPLHAALAAARRLGEPGDPDAPRPLG